ncbi:PfkB family carbohydrate kinase [Candidatus Thioglobus sp.]|jgi:sulfofructose kinase|nr:PfkB family carbohydrate kinase [Candidatus Thioglobus sp.]
MIICVGPIFLDRVVKIDSFPKKPIKLVAKGLEKRLGGPAAVASFAVNILGESSEFVSRFGDDDAAEFLQSELNEYNINFAKSITVKGALSSQSHIFEDKHGERMLAVFNEKKLLDEKILPNFNFKNDQTYLIDAHWIEVAHYVAKNTHDRGINCVVDLDNFSKNKTIEEIINYSSHPIFSETGLLEYTSDESIIDSLKSLYNNNNKFYAVTLGPKGVYWIDKGKIYHCAAPKVKVVETNGAGDVFHGAFVRFIHANKTIQESIELATLAASLKCTRRGGIRAIPSFNELIKFSHQFKLTTKIK